MTFDELKNLSVAEASMDVLDDAAIEEHVALLSEWQLDDEGRLVTDFEVEDFSSAVDLLNAIASLAEEQGHHPDLFIHDYKGLLVSLYTHDASGLTLKDFAMAAKIEDMLSGDSNEE